MSKWLFRLGWMALGVGALYGVSALAGVVSGGSLEPPGPVGSTMKTLEEIPGTWSRKLSDSGSDSCNTPRFTCVLDGAGVRDNETGLVWEKAPTTLVMHWSSAQVQCASAIAGGRGGWRLPTDIEMRSLLDPNATSQPLLPDGHPFDIFVPHGYVWTSSPVPIENDLAYAVDTDTLDRSPSQRTFEYKKWCVRGVQADAPEGSALAEAPPSWYRTLDATGGCFSERFRCVMNGEAVLDRETGLVWERYPSEIGNGVWYSALDDCQQVKTTGDRVGWRLPALAELMSLLEAPGFASLPAGHPFLATLPSRYWTATTDADITGNAFAVLVQAVTSSQSYAKDGSHGQTIRAWCVRGPGGYEGL